MFSWINAWILNDNKLWSTIVQIVLIFWDLVNFFFFNFKVNGFFNLFSPQCTAFRLPAPEGTEIALARSAVTLCYLSGALCCIWYYYNFSTLKLFTLPFFKQCIFLLMSIITSAQVSLPVTASYIFVDVFRLCLQLSPFSTFHWDSSTTLLVSVLMTLLPRLGSLVVLLNEHPSHLCSYLSGLATRRVQRFTYFTCLQWNSQKKNSPFLLN